MKPNPTNKPSTKGKQGRKQFKCPSCGRDHEYRKEGSQVLVEMQCACGYDLTSLATEPEAQSVQECKCICHDENCKTPDCSCVLCYKKHVTTPPHPKGRKQAPEWKRPKYPDGYIMRGEDNELYMLWEKKWYQLREGTVLDLIARSQKEVAESCEVCGHGKECFEYLEKKGRT